MILSRANFATFFTSLAIQACGAGTGVMTARLLGPAARGELSTVILWPMILSNLGLLGCNCALARQVAGEPGNERHWVAAGLRIGATSAPLFYVLGYFLLPLVLPADKGYLLPLARICLLMIPLDTFNQLLLS